MNKTRIDYRPKHHKLNAPKILLYPKQINSSIKDDVQYPLSISSQVGT